MKIRPVGVESFRADRRMDTRTDMMKLKVTFCHFANTPENEVQVNCISCETKSLPYKEIFLLDFHHFCSSGPDILYSLARVGTVLKGSPVTCVRSEYKHVMLQSSKS
jgi:hypothetical protein